MSLASRLIWRLIGCVKAIKERRWGRGWDAGDVRLAGVTVGGGGGGLGVRNRSAKKKPCFARTIHFNSAGVHCVLQVFLSIKGVYFQAEIQGQSVNWLVPWKFSQLLPKDVDYRVMLTFLEFHEVCLRGARMCVVLQCLGLTMCHCVHEQVLMKFVMFKLYHTVGLTYPPVIKTDAVARGGLLSAVQLTKEGATSATAGAAAPAVSATSVAALPSTASKQQNARLKSLQTLLKGAAATAPAEGQLS